MIVAVIGLTGKNYKELQGLNKKCSVDKLKAIAENE
jgi:hypothetical protein